MSKRKDDGLLDALNDIMGRGQAGEVQETPRGPTTEAQRTPKGPTTEAQDADAARETKKVRFDRGDYGRLQEIAARRGTTAAALIRGAVKEIIARAGGA